MEQSWAYLVADITVGATSLTIVDNEQRFPTSNFLIIIDSETILVGARSGKVFSGLTRGAGSTLAASHTAGARAQGGSLPEIIRLLQLNDAGHTHAEIDVANLVANLATKQATSEKGQALGYASLDSGSKVPAVQLGTGTPDATTFLRGDRVWAAVSISAIQLWGHTGNVVAEQGLNLPVALTELDTTNQGTRQLVEAADIGTQVQLHVNVRVGVGGVGLTAVEVSIRDTSNTANILAFVTFDGTTGGTTRIVKSTWAAKPSWLIGDKTLGAYTQSGDGAADFVFRDISLRHKA